MSAILTLAVAVGLQDRPAVAPPAPEPWDKNFQLFTHCSWADAGSALGTIVCDSLSQLAEGPPIMAGKRVAVATLPRASSQLSIC